MDHWLTLMPRIGRPLEGSGNDGHGWEAISGSGAVCGSLIEAGGGGEGEEREEEEKVGDVNIFDLRTGSQILFDTGSGDQK